MQQGTSWPTTAQNRRPYPEPKPTHSPPNARPPCCCPRPASAVPRPCEHRAGYDSPATKTPPPPWLVPIRSSPKVGSVATACSSARTRSEAPTSELQPLKRISYAVFCLEKKKT